MKKSIKSETKILVMLSFFCIALGLWTNFRQLWLESNGIIPEEISRILSASIILSSLWMIPFSIFVKMNRIKKFVSWGIIIKIGCLFTLFLLNGTSDLGFLKLVTIVDIIIEKLIVISIYPLITTIKRDDQLFGKKNLVEYGFKDIGILLGGIILGQSFGNIVVDYNTCLLLSSIFLGFAFLTNCSIKIPVINSQKKTASHTGFWKYIKNHPFLKYFFLYSFVGNIAYNTALGLQMLTLTNYFQFSGQQATFYFLIIGLCSDIFGILALKWLTPKNDYITPILKYGFRCLGYLLVFLFNQPILTICVITFSLFVGAAYEHKLEAPYFNCVEIEYQLPFNNIRSIIGNFGVGIGTFFCGVMYTFGIRYMFGLSAFFIIFQILLTYVLLIKRKKYS